MSNNKSTPARRRRKPTVTKPEKPSPDFPLRIHAAGYYSKKIRGKAHCCALGRCIRSPCYCYTTGPSQTQSVGREALESSSADFQTAASIFQGIGKDGETDRLSCCKFCGLLRYLDSYNERERERERERPRAAARGASSSPTGRRP